MLYTKNNTRATTVEMWELLKKEFGESNFLDTMVSFLDCNQLEAFVSELIEEKVIETKDFYIGEL